MKKFFAVILSLSITLTSLISFSGCSDNNANNLTVGKWLTMVDESFGMTSSKTSEPFFKSVNVDSPYFAAVQIAADWDVIDKDKDIDVDKLLTWKETLVTLVNVGNFMPTDSSEDEKINYAIEHFDNSIRDYWLDRNIGTDKAVTLLGTAQKLWATKEYDHVTEEAKYKDGVIDLSQGNNKIIDYTINDDGVIVIPKKGVQSNNNSEYDSDEENPNNSNEVKDFEIKENDIYVLPQNDKNKFVQAYKAESITSDDDYYYIKNSDDEIKLDDVAQDVFVEESYEPTMENAIIYDGSGNVVSVGKNVQPQYSAYANNNLTLQSLALSGNSNADVVPVDIESPTQKHTFKIDDWNISLKYKLDGELDLGVEIETPNLLKKEYTKAHPNEELKVTFSGSLNKFKITNEIDYKWFQLKSAMLRADYEQTFSGKLTAGKKVVNKVYAPEYRNTGKFLTNWAKSTWKDADGDNAKGAKTIKIGSVDIYTIGVARVCLDINFNVSAEGTASITCTLRGANGVEYKNGNLRSINTCDKDVDVDLKAKIEATIGVGPALYVVGLKKPIIGLEIKGGLGATLKVKLNLADTENHLIESADSGGFSGEFAQAVQGTSMQSSAEQIKKIAESQGCTYKVETSENVKLHLDVCGEGSVYAILSIGVTDTSYIADLFGSKISTSWQILGESNAKLLYLHMDNTSFQFGHLGKDVECKLKYVPFDSNANTETTTSSESENDDANINNSIPKGDSLDLNEMYTEMLIGQNYYIQIAQLPNGYDVDQLVCESSDNKIVTVNDDGVVSAESKGTATVTVKTKDNKFKTYLAVTVVGTNEKQFEPLRDVNSNSRFLGNDRGVKI